MSKALSKPTKAVETHGKGTVLSHGGIGRFTTTWVQSRGASHLRWSGSGVRRPAIAATQCVVSERQRAEEYLAGNLLGTQQRSAGREHSHCCNSCCALVQAKETGDE